MRISTWVFVCAACLGVSGAVAAAQEVHIGGAHFPPYVIKPEGNEAGGLLPELIGVFNAAQSDYRFVLVPTAIPRRFRDFQQGRIDLAMFENPGWGWDGIEGSRIDMGLEDAEIYVAQASEGRDERYFDELKSKRLALYSGYHYGFADFNSDPAFLAREFNTVSTYSHDSNLMMVMRGRAEVALVTRSYFGAYLEAHPEQREFFLPSQRVDQVYRHYALLRPGAPIDANAFSALLDRLRADGRLERIFSRYQIEVKPTARDSSTIGHVAH
ncbi:transporter substrate-binding domain-containing protein [Pseudomonas sp. RIT-PI-AD]|uniref:substrate-binding periplasmic protein n=1 Tax=Pseudomonas sp. RIT-PI-AD TaxID=3035294 RepID=UPI0021DADE0B|nr:transporter substrate-binding domain-containing protein [Pseudomonas sp. RIT-PI-AD]